MNRHEDEPTKRIIKLLTVQEILDEEHEHKMGVRVYSECPFIRSVFSTKKFDGNDKI
jgi:hypothetical protein